MCCCSLQTFLEGLWKQLEDDSSMVCTLLHSHLDVCKLAVERSVVCQIYADAMHPNGKADVSRDEVLADHIRRLAMEVTPSHPSLKIPVHFHYEQPWPSAQAEIRRLAAYKTPQDKVNCVVRCSQTIMNLLAMATKPGILSA